ncbi:MAG TPA: SDR family NAD(P)-dependent oxidoreductase [Candidatus Binatia bacterium]|jgi:NAD(P)-dependent dehydrogenase (short-subunit alcohol dehydrogenase family)
MKLDGKIALITGGGRGIGKAVAMAYARAGAAVGICARTEKEIEETRSEIVGLGGRCEAWACDISDLESVDKLIKQMEKTFARIDVLVNNAGVMTRPAALTDLEVKKWDYTIAVNLRGTFLVTRAVLPVMIREKSGSIINVSSSIGRSGYANFTAYAASKWGIEGFTQSLAAETRAHQIRVNSIDPGYVATKLTGYRGSNPESVSGVFLYLASDESKKISGKMLSSSSWKAEI